MYIELHAASAFSFLQGASLPEALVQRAADLGYPAMALLDADGVYGAPRFHKAAQKAGLKARVGAERTIDSGGKGERGQGGRADQGTRLSVLVQSAEGYKNLCRLVTRMKMRAPKGEGALALEELDGYTSGLVALVGPGTFAPSAPSAHQPSHRRTLEPSHLDRVVGLFG